MPRFILNDESKINSYGFRIRTQGISLERFSNNPVMLDGHNPSNLAVIGKWTSFKAENGKLTADTEFDIEDPHANIIAGKVERGLINGASMGISFSKNDFSYENGELVLNQCELYEASIVAIPSNTNAIRLRMDDEDLTEMDIKELCLSIAQNSTYQNNQSNMKFKLGQLAMLALGFAVETKELTTDEIEQSILKLSKERDELRAQIQLSEEKVNAYIAKEKKEKTELTAKMLDEAVQQGKITAEKRATFLELAQQNFELFQSTLEALPVKKNFSAGINTPAGTQGVTSMEDFQKLSIEEQLAFKNAEPEAYKKLVNTIG
ncbi:phage prohead protease, HK97 family [Candidatus Ornithobacterium hominis]|uniref:HK97 family phage prohead protease n=1 Tax=Candidatus Ornithobacterium hominis TaxID=2497989 RepID=UPI000E5ADE45|nr:HK97 family phage prohead protease [Candidatus Ornithobacterium hominis]SZD72758.1 phage prohead protease, HK97 family [Candidatus Ornithobacterium hominis]